MKENVIKKIVSGVFSQIPEQIDYIFEKSGIKDHLDFVVHGAWVEATSAVVETAGRITRPLIKHILDGQNADLEAENG
jgi:hypothetical protein